MPRGGIGKVWLPSNKSGRMLKTALPLMTKVRLLKMAASRAVLSVLKNRVKYFPVHKNVLVQFSTSSGPLYTYNPGE